MVLRDNSTKSALQQTLTMFMRSYEEANNSHNFVNVEPFIAPAATYWFSDGSFTGMEEIHAAIEATFTAIQNEDYRISDLLWPIVCEDVAVCTYYFSWSGVVGGQPKSGDGRGTNVLQKSDGLWQIVHEHLSV